MQFAAYMAVFLSHSFGSILYHCIYGCMFFMLLFNFVSYVLLLYTVLCILFHCFSVYCLCVSLCCTSATGCQLNCS
jgi:hypothetical protein